MKMRNRLLAFAMTLCAMCMVFICFSFNTYAADESDFTISVSNNYGGEVIRGEYTPINITVSNSGKDFTGRLQLIYSYTEDDNAMYEQEVSLPTGVSKTFNFVIPIQTEYKDINIRIANAKGKVIKEQTESLTIASYLSHYNIGILSDDYNACGYMDSLELLRYPMITTKIYELKDKSIPDTWQALDMFDCIVVSDYSTDVLTEQQRGAIYQWVNQGGLLIVGTGATASKTMNGFNGYVLNATVGDSLVSHSTTFGTLNSSIFSDWNYCYYTDEDGNIQVNESLEKYYQLSSDQVDTCDYELLGSNVVKVDADDSGNSTFPLYSYLQCGDGYIVLTGVDFTKNPMPKSMGARYMVLDIIDKTVFNTFYEKVQDYTFGYLYGYGTGYAQENMIESLSGANMVPVLIYILLIAAYFIAIIVLFVVFKKKNKSIKLWVAFPTLSLGTAILIGCFSLASKVNRLTLNTATIMNLGDGRIDEDNYISAIIPRKGDYSLAFSDNYFIETRSDEAKAHYYGSQPSLSSYKYKFVLGTDSMQADLEDAAAMSTAEYVLKDSYLEDGDITLSFDGTDFTMTNNMGYDLKNVVIVYNDFTPQNPYSSLYSVNQFIYGDIDKVKAGDSLVTKDASCSVTSYATSDDLTLKAVGNGDKEFLMGMLLGNITNEYKDFYMTRSIIDYIWDESDLESGEALVIAFPADDVCEDIITDKKAKISRKIVLVKKFDLGEIQNVGN